MYRLHCFSQSGNCFKVAFLLRCKARVDKHLAAREFLVGSGPTIADFSLSGYLFYPVEESGYDVRTRFPGIGAWLARVQALPGWGSPYAILPGEQIKPKW